MESLIDAGVAGSALSPAAILVGGFLLFACLQVLVRFIPARVRYDDRPIHDRAARCRRALCPAFGFCLVFNTKGLLQEVAVRANTHAEFSSNCFSAMVSNIVNICNASIDSNFVPEAVRSTATAT